MMHSLRFTHHKSPDPYPRLSKNDKISVYLISYFWLFAIVIISMVGVMCCKINSRSGWILQHMTSVESLILLRVSFRQPIPKTQPYITKKTPLSTRDSEVILSARTRDEQTCIHKERPLMEIL